MYKYIRHLMLEYVNESLHNELTGGHKYYCYGTVEEYFITCTALENSVQEVTVVYQRVGRLSMYGWLRPAHGVRTLESRLNSRTLVF